MKNRWIARALFAALVTVGAASQAIADNGGTCAVTNNCNGFVNGGGTIPEPGVLELLGMGVAGAIAVRLIKGRRK